MNWRCSKFRCVLLIAFLLAVTTQEGSLSAQSRQGPTTDMASPASANSTPKPQDIVPNSDQSKSTEEASEQDGWFQWLNKNAGASQALLAAALLAATLYSVVVTQKTLKANRRMAEANATMAEAAQKQMTTMVRPIVAFRFIEAKSFDNPVIEICNLGAGPAIDLRIKLDSSELTYDLQGPQQPLPLAARATIQIQLALSHEQRLAFQDRNRSMSASTVVQIGEFIATYVDINGYLYETRMPVTWQTRKRTFDAGPTKFCTPAS